MASSLVDLVKINVSNTGSGAITLGSAVEGYRGRDVLTNGTVYSYSIQQGSAWEFGRGTYLAESAQIIRSVIDSSDGGTALNLKPNAQIAFTALSADLMPQVQLTADIQAKVDAATAAQTGAETAQGLSEDARDASVAAKDIAVAKAGEAAGSAAAADGFRQRASNAVPFTTWTALAAATGMSAGDKAQVLAADTGTHTDPVAGGTVNNAGIYTYSTSPAGWQRVGDLDSKTAALAVAATRRPFGVEIYNAGSAITQGIYNGDYNATSNFTINRFTAVMEDGTTGATADITVLVNGVAVYGPVTVTFGAKLITAPSYSMPSGADDQYLVERMTGTVRKVYIRADGVPS